ncbi:hypothetical protein [Brunnivagina elsteri]|uniref:Primosomal protein n=1 Tax=Brunnivagina elsteri CCALA 953 TaxID=987040 RepID=A0A2A2TIB0_9CYAN|nr:hypothetical protein [Calothrix elsteri]PAX53484.1 hypothetical protein CK510_13685 [Calothrix elsteri CCALA 953]
MARAIERIERDIQALEEAIALVAQELYASYTVYLTSLGQAVRKQLILATYHLCTQGYPEAFIGLSLSQRQNLQKAIRDLGTQTAERLVNYSAEENEASNSTSGEELLTSDGLNHQDYLNHEMEVAIAFEMANEGLEDSEDESLNPLAFVELSLDNENSPFEMGELEDEDEDDEDDEDEDEDEEGEKLTKKARDRIRASILSANFPFSKFTPPKPLPFAKINPSNPIEISQWQQSIEITSQFALKKASREANLLIQKSGILPKSLPEPILEVAAAASEASAQVMPGPPNLINLVIEVDDSMRSRSGSVEEGKPRRGNLTQIMAINLRLGEIEFADSVLSGKHKQIRMVVGQLQKLRRDYMKKQRERAIAEAEGAWRASWFED